MTAFADGRSFGAPAGAVSRCSALATFVRSAVSFALAASAGGQNLERELGVGACELVLDRERPFAVLVGLCRAELLAVAHDGDVRARCGAAGEHRGALRVDARHVKGAFGVVDGLCGLAAQLGLEVFDRPIARCRLFRGRARLLDRRSDVGKIEIGIEHPHRSAEQHEQQDHDRHSEACHLIVHPAPEAPARRHCPAKARCVQGRGNIGEICLPPPSVLAGARAGAKRIARSGLSGAAASMS